MKNQKESATQEQWAVPPTLAFASFAARSSRFAIVKVCHLYFSLLYSIYQALIPFHRF